MSDAKHLLRDAGQRNLERVMNKKMASSILVEERRRRRQCSG
jgi:hypothetical protein